MKILMMAAIFALSAGVAAAQSDKPGLPYYDWGACPFECCTYRDWTSKREVDAHVGQSEKSPVSFRLKKGTEVRGLTGVVITRKYGTTKIVEPIQVYAPDGRPELSLQPEEVVYTLHYLGEGEDLFWYRGKTYSAQIAVPDDAWGTPPNAQSVRVVSRPTYEWWVIIQDKDGNTGWTKETDAFEHKDACE